MNAHDRKGGPVPGSAPHEKNGLSFNKPLKKPSFFIGLLLIIAAFWRVVSHDVHWIDVAVQLVVSAAGQKVHF